MEDLKRLLAYGLDYNDAVLAVEACNSSDSCIEFNTRIIAAWSKAEEELIKRHEGPMYEANNVKIMMLCLEDNQLAGLN